MLQDRNGTAKLGIYRKPYFQPPQLIKVDTTPLYQTLKQVCPTCPLRACETSLRTTSIYKTLSKFFASYFRNTSVQHAWATRLRNMSLVAICLLKKFLQHYYKTSCNAFYNTYLYRDRLIQNLLQKVFNFPTRLSRRLCDMSSTLYKKRFPALLCNTSFLHIF